MFIFTPAVVIQHKTGYQWEPNVRKGQRPESGVQRNTDESKCDTFKPKQICDHKPFDVGDGSIRDDKQLQNCGIQTCKWSGSNMDTRNKPKFTFLCDVITKVPPPTNLYNLTLHSFLNFHIISFKPYAWNVRSRLLSTGVLRFKWAVNKKSPRRASSLRAYLCESGLNDKILILQNQAGSHFRALPPTGSLPSL